MSNRSVPKAENSTRTALDKSISSAPSAKDASKDEDTDIARLKIPQSAIKELQALVNTPREPIKDRGNTGPRDRLFASILTVTTVAALEGVIGCLGASFPAVAGLLAGFLAWFLCTWTLVHGRGLNRRRIALFNERNFLDTYQVFNREFGHLFQPEPNTPGGCCGPAPETLARAPCKPSARSSSRIRRRLDSKTPSSSTTEECNERQARPSGTPAPGSCESRQLRRRPRSQRCPGTRGYPSPRRPS
ncbi:hypothetical protein L596_016550 [Steinernema carpocapsae]|uniref:Uncharacterized protein n=1 Tax=Steinernema carpocapsae TaxID=34508 RepID=A0A4U5NJ22_STECR|nr:hypothetical protein L596_016550 [Steinernema carpocapsae]